MTADKQIAIEAIDDKSPHLPRVIKLWSPNRATLGFLPQDAFTERAAKRQILVAIYPEVGCIGYLLYRSSYDRITIVHLCVAPSHRGMGIAKLLVDELKQITKEKYRGIGLSCRRDYELGHLWSSLDFLPQHDKTGRSRDKKLLTFWWFDHGHPDLFSAAPIAKLESKLCVVIDANIFLNLYDDEALDNEESELLLADWLEQPELALCITDEIFNYINIISDDNKRKMYRDIANSPSFTRLQCQSKTFDAVKENLEKFLADKNLVIKEFDRRYLARAISSDSHVFVTREQRLLEVADELYDKFRLSIRRPNDLITQLDELQRQPDYQPVRLAGTLLKQLPVQKGMEESLTDYFYCVNQEETKARFQQQLRRFLAEPDKFQIYLISEGEDHPLALVVYGKHKKHELEIPLLRVAEDPRSATLARHLIFKSILGSAREGQQFTRITDLCLQPSIMQAIQEETFVKVKNGFLKVNLAVAETAYKLALHLTEISNLGEEYSFCRQIAASLNTEYLKDVDTSAHIERFLFPAKIIDAEIPTFIIPIQPRWAKELFDEELATQTIWGRKDELAFNREAVYYGSVQSLRILKAPCRILWYVSKTQNEGKGKGFNGVGAVRACSFVDEIIIGKPKDLYQRFQRLGVYTLTDILKVNVDKNDNIIAIRFINNELFNNIIPLSKVQAIIDKRLSFQSAYKINDQLFNELYNLGMS